MDQRPFDGMVMIIRYDGKPPKPLTAKDGKKIEFFLDKKGFPIYIADKDLARQMCSARPDRYRLYCSPALDVRIPDAKGALQWKKIYPWAYDVRRVENGTDKENGEVLYRDVIEWLEDKDERRMASASIEFITGEKPKSANPHLFDEHSLMVKKENARLIEENTKLTETIKKQGDQISELMAKVNALATQVSSMGTGKLPTQPSEQKPLSGGYTGKGSK